jgi:methylthioribose-1-phosphate isomerase
LSRPLLMDINYTVFLRDEKLIIIDRRGFPRKVEELLCSDCEQVAQAIENMAVQGAGDIAIAAAYGLYLAAKELESKCSYRIQAKQCLQEPYQRLINTRPTGHYLKSLLDKIMSSLDDRLSPADQILLIIRQAIQKQQRRSELTGEWAEQLLQDGDTILTHCFPGPALLYMLQMASSNKKRIKVIACETRPYLQGARLTAPSVAALNIPVTLISDNMAAYCMAAGMINKVFTAADRIALDGTVANKVGTFQLALAAHYHQLPFYILGYSGPDRKSNHAADIPIEIRDPGEVLSYAGHLISGDGVQGFYPAFDLTPAELISAIITDRGIFQPELIQEYWT